MPVTDAKGYLECCADRECCFTSLSEAICIAVAAATSASSGNTEIEG
ncbi:MULTISPECIES: hypothetical protein [Acidianus]|nr:MULTISPECIES: hypothetical protein [Acidianus]NON62067.1 hypothetical protein [Acidianus sp. RZ1]